MAFVCGSSSGSRRHYIASRASDSHRLSCYAGGGEPQQKSQEEGMPGSATSEQATDTAVGAGVRIHTHLRTSFP